MKIAVTPPCETLRAEMAVRKLSGNMLARSLHVSANTVTEILRNNRAISAIMALRFGRYFGTGPEFWLNLQRNYDLRVAKELHWNDIKKQVMKG